MRTLQDLAKAVVAQWHEYDRLCRCVTCHKQALQCLDCPECRQRIEDDTLDLLRKANRK